MKNADFQKASNIARSTPVYSIRFACRTLLATLMFPASFALASPVQSASYIEAENAADREIEKMEKECLIEDEKPTVKRKQGFRKSVSLGGDTWAFIISGEKLRCIKASMCGTAGCQLKVVSNAAGTPKVIYSGQVRNWEIVNRPNRSSTLRLDVHGSHCGKSGSVACFETMDLGSGAVSIIK